MKISIQKEPGDIARGAAYVMLFVSAIALMRWENQWEAAKMREILAAPLAQAGDPCIFEPGKFPPAQCQ